MRKLKKLRTFLARAKKMFQLVDKKLNLDGSSLHLRLLGLLQTTGEHCLKKKIVRIKTIKVISFLLVEMGMNIFMGAILDFLTLKYGEDEARRTL